MTLNSLLAGLRRRWAIVVAFIVLGGLAAGAYAVVATKVYQGETSLFVSLQTTTTNTPAELVAGNNYAAQKVPSYVEIAHSKRVLDQVATLLGADPADLPDEVTATAQPNSVVITITGQSPNPDDAALLANTVASVFANVVVNEIESPVGGGPGPIKVEIIAAAQAPADPVSPNLFLSLALGLFGGLVIGVALAIVLTLLDRRVRSQADVVATLDRPVLGTVASTRSGSKRSTEVAISDFRTLAVTVNSLAAGRPFASVAVASPNSAPAAAETAAGLAQALADAGKTTVVVDAVFDGNGASSYFNASALTGLREVLSGALPLSEAVATTSLEKLRVLPVGRDQSVRANALSSAALTAIIQELAKTADFVVIDGGVVLGSGDALATRASADEAIVAVDAGSVSTDQLTSAVDQLEVIGTPVLGVVIAKRDRRAKGVKVRVSPTVVASQAPPLRTSERILSS